MPGAVTSWQPGGTGTQACDVTLVTAGCSDASIAMPTCAKSASSAACGTQSLIGRYVACVPTTRPSVCVRSQPSAPAPKLPKNGMLKSVTPSLKCLRLRMIDPWNAVDVPTPCGSTVTT